MAIKRLHVGLFRAFANVLTVLFLLLAIPLTVGIYAEAFVEADQKAKFPPPGQVVDIGGGEFIHIRVWGQPSSKPTLLLFVSGQSVSSAWAWIAHGLESEYRVVAFDRSGMAWSQGANGLRDAEHAARALDVALSTTGIGPPYVVVGHSYGGFSARVFAAEHRSDVAAMVLLDTSHPDAPGSGYGLISRMDALRAHAGLLLLGPPVTGYGPLPSGEGQAANAVFHWTSHLDAVADELETWDASAAEVRAAGTFGEMPLLIVAAAQNPQQRTWQLDLRNLSTASQYVELNVGHSEMLVDEDQAALTTAEIQRFLAGAGL